MARLGGGGRKRRRAGFGSGFGLAVAGLVRWNGGGLNGGSGLVRLSKDSAALAIGRLAGVGRAGFAAVAVAAATAVNCFARLRRQFTGIAPPAASSTVATIGS